MRYSIIVLSALAITIVLSLAFGQDDDKNPDHLGRCTTSESCSNSSMKCVDGYCTMCTDDPRTCLRSVESCQKLRCRRDEGCYVREKYDHDEQSVTSTLVCAKTLPCTRSSCTRQKCYNTPDGDRPPVPQCRPSGSVNVCYKAGCGDDARCVVRAYWSLRYAFKSGVCLPYGDCEHCNSQEYCEITKGEDDVHYVGQCVRIPDNRNDDE